MKAKTVKDLIEQLKQLDSNMCLVTAKDEEGNGYDFVYYDVTVGYMSNGDFIDNANAKSEFSKKHFHGCDVEPDGWCVHKCPSILLAMGLI